MNTFSSCSSQCSGRQTCGSGVPLQSGVVGKQILTNADTHYVNAFMLHECVCGGGEGELVEWWWT